MRVVVRRAFLFCIGEKWDFRSVVKLWWVVGGILIARGFKLICVSFWND